MVLPTKTAISLGIVFEQYFRKLKLFFIQRNIAMLNPKIGIKQNTC